MRSRNCRSNSLLKIAVTECCRNRTEKSATKNNRTEMLLEKLSLETFVKEVTKKLSLNNCAKCYLNHYLSKLSSKISVAERCRKKYLKSVPKNNRFEVLKKVSRKIGHRTEMLKCRSKNCHSNCSSSLP